jgi:Rad3-related DNA helicase
VIRRRKNLLPLLPSHKIIIIDEAHKLIDAARQMYGTSVNQREIYMLGKKSISKTTITKESRQIKHFGEELTKYSSMLFEELVSNIPESVNQDETEITYIINGKEVSNPIQGAYNDGSCVILGYDEPLTDNDSDINGELDIEWGDFVKETNELNEDLWKIDITITNNESANVYLDINAFDKQNRWAYISNGFLSSEKISIHSIGINHYSFDEVSYGMRNIKIHAYECNKLSESNKNDICNSDLEPSVVLQNNIDNGTPISPTLISEKFFNFNSTSTPPLEVSEEEYLR